MSKKNDISNEEYTSILVSTGVIVIVIMLAFFAGGAYAITKLFHWQWWQGVALFLLFVVIWSRKPKGK